MINLHTFCLIAHLTDRKLNCEQRSRPPLNNTVPFLCICFQDECHNFIKVLVPRNDDLVFICGTNGFNPMCRYYRVSIEGGGGSGPVTAYSLGKAQAVYNNHAPNL